MSPRNELVLRSVIAVLLMAAVAVGCGSGGEDSSGTSATATTSTTTAATTTPAPDIDLASAEAALESFARETGSDAIYSPIAVGPGGGVAAVAYGSPERVDVVRFETDTWLLITTLEMPLGAVVATGVQGPDTCETQCIETVSLTGSTNFVVTLLAATSIAAAVLEVADDATSARVVPFGQGGDLYASVRGGFVDGQTIISSENDCTPNCVEGTSTETPWSYDPTSEMFRPDLGD